MMAAATATRRRQTLQQRRWTIMPATYLIAIVLVGITLAPLLFVIVDGFRTNADINSSPIGVPHPWVLSNYTSILGTAPFWQFLGNSALVAVVATAMAVVLGSMAAFALSRYQFPGREAIFTLFISGLLFPLGVAALPLYLLLQHLGLLDNQLGLAVVEAAFALPVTMLIMRGFMRAIPGELEDAALVDGAGKLRFFVRIL